MKRPTVFAWLLLALLPYLLVAQLDGDRLIEAAQNGDLVLVRELLAKGVDVNARTRYGATPLFFACDKGNVELTKLLLGKGADVNVVDTFYGATPTTWVLFSAKESEPHREILGLLLEEGPNDAAAALPLAAEIGDMKLAQSVVASEKADAQALTGAIEIAKEAGNQAVAAYLQQQLPEGSAELRVEVPVERLQTKVGDYEEADTATPDAFADLPKIERTGARPWPAFRGADTAGIGDGQGVPTQWDGPTGKNILWKTPIPGLANSSPIIWGDKIFVTTASTEEGDDTLRIGLYGDVDSIEDTAEHTWAVFALNRGTGEILWRRVAATGIPKVKRHMKSTHANPTPVTDGQHVVASFGSEGVYCYDFDGKLLWKKDLGVLESGWFYDPTYEWGFGSSPIIFRGQVILQVDIQTGSFIAALDVTTGKVVWQTERDEIPTWGTPVILPSPEADGADEIVTNGTTVRGYDAATGELLWWLQPNSEITVASPIVGDGLAFVTGGYPPARPVYAVHPGGRGDLSLPEGEASSKAIAWSLDKGGAYMPTPLLYQGILYVFHGNGRLAALNATTGESIYKERVGSGNSFSGSPVAADGRLLITSEQGETFVVRAGRDFQILARNTVDEVVMSTPAISDGLMAVRAKSHVYGIGEAKKSD